MNINNISTRKIAIVILMWLGATALLAVMCSCTMPQVIMTKPDGSLLAMNGGSLATKSDVDTAEMTLPNGATMKRNIVKKNEVSVPNTYLYTELLKPLVSDTGTALVKGTKDPNIIPKDPNVIPADPNVIPVNPNLK